MINHNTRTTRLATTISVLIVASALAGCVTAPNANDGTDAGASANASGQTAKIDMKDLKYGPDTLTVAPGTKVTWTNLDPFAHTVTPTDKALWATEGSGDATSKWMGQGATWSFTFTKEGTFQYYCIPHASKKADGTWAGMVATVIVKAGAAPAGGTGSGSQDGSAAASPPAVRAIDVPEIGADASAVPPAITRSAPAELTFTLTSREVVATMADGITYSYWTFDGQVPGPMLRARVGDTITVVHHNDASSAMSHNIDFHAVTGPGGGAHALTAAPGETKTLTFKALNAGVYVYHCADAAPPVHVAHGMYGLIVIEPEGGLPPVDREYYVMQGDFYSGYALDQPGHHAYESKKALAEEPTFVVFNGRVGSLKDDRQLEADVGETVRIWFGVGGPNLASSFHVIGEIFDRTYNQGSLTSEPVLDLQTTLVPAGGATMVEFTVEVPGDYVLVDHSIFRVLKGAAAILHVSGADDGETFVPEH